MDRLKKRMRKFKAKAVTSATHKSRTSQWKCYKLFCKKFHLSPLCVSVSQLSLYVVFLSEFLCHASILAYLQCLKYMSFTVGFAVPDIHHPELKFILRGIECFNPHGSCPSRPMRWCYFRRMFDHICLSTPVYCQFWTACLLMFRALLRISHVICSDHSLFWSDVKFKKWGVLLCIRSAKCRYSGVHEIPLASLPEANRFCVVYWLKRLFLSKKGDVVFPLLNYSNFRSMLKFSLLRAHVHVHLTSHSFRRGGASFLSSVGVPINQIKVRGGWKLDCVKKYISELRSVHVRRELLVLKNFC